MSTTSTVLSNFFNIDTNQKDNIPDLLRNEEHKPVMEDLSKVLKKKAVPPNYFNKILDHIPDLLNLDLRAIILNAWCSSGKFDAYLDTNKFSPEETILVPLAEHTIKSVHSPSIKPIINSVPLGEIEFTIYLDLKIGGASLSIKNGKIAEFSIGSCMARAIFQYNNIVIFDKECNIPQITGEIRLPDGIAIKDTAEMIHNSISTMSRNDRIDNKN